MVRLLIQWHLLVLVQLLGPALLSATNSEETADNRVKTPWLIFVPDSQTGFRPACGSGVC